MAQTSGENERPQSLGDRVRLRRRAAGLSQTALAAGRFSKEYLSQIERGKTTPPAETIEWLAGRLGTDRAYLEHGLSEADRGRADHALAAAQRLSDEHRYEDAAAAFGAVRSRAETLGVPSLRLIALRGEIWADLRQGLLAEARELLDDARELSSGAGFSDLDRGEVQFLDGVASYMAADFAGAIVQLGTALELAEGSGLPCDRLRSRIFEWRSRAWRQLRDWEAAREDVGRALELADAAADPRGAGLAHFQASIVSQREGQWVLARRHAEQARALFEQLGDRMTVGRLLNNLAGLDHLLGKPERAVEQLRSAFEIFVDLDLAPEAGYVLSSLADVHLDMGDAVAAETQARKALELLGDRVDHLQEIGTAHLVLGRSLTAQQRLVEAEESIATANRVFEEAKSASHLADAWIAQGDLAGRAGDDRSAAKLYRSAAEALLETQSA